MGTPHSESSMSTMFFAGLILLIPHRIGMSRVNYVIKRYNLPISRAGLLLYKYHNNIELSLTIGTLAGNIIVWILGAEKKPKKIVSYLMIVFLIFMLISSIIMFIIYISGGDYGHLNAFYFSLIFLTLFDGFANAFAFAINAPDSSLLSAGIPLSGFLVTLLHYIYKFFSDSFHWDDFDYYVLRLQLLCNVITIFIALGLWSYDAYEEYRSSTPVAQPNIMDLFNSEPNFSDSNNPTNAHICDWLPIFMLAISLGTVYAFYPSIAPYSIIDFQYASIIELWILILSALLPFSFAVLDYFKYGPSGDAFVKKTISDVSGTVNFTQNTISINNLQVKHAKSTGVQHPSSSTTSCSQGNPTTAHAYDSSSTTPYTYTIKSGDQYQETVSGTSETIQHTSSLSSGITVYYYHHHNWVQYNKTIKKVNVNASTVSLKTSDTSAINKTPSSPDRWCWNLIWICAIFYILCIQIFMSLLHYPHSLLSCLFNNNPYLIVFISILFNTLRELLQACAFAGAGKQCTNLNSEDIGNNRSNTSSANSGTIIWDTFDLTGYSITKDTPSTNQVKLTNNGSSGGIEIKNATGTAYDLSTSGISISGTVSGSIKLTKFKLPFGSAHINGTIAATNKLITLFVMMFCVFTGDGYLQHYRRCCRDNWPTTGYNKYQSFFYWLHFGFKGGIKSFTTVFTWSALLISLQPSVMKSQMM